MTWVLVDAQSENAPATAAELQGHSLAASPDSQPRKLNTPQRSPANDTAPSARPQRACAAAHRQQEQLSTGASLSTEHGNSLADYSTVARSLTVRNDSNDQEE